ncbi:MAG: NAD(P)-dependent oxidoreductase [Pseudomonadota bacterium]
MTRLILDPHWRTMDELFSPKARDHLARFEVVWGQDAPIPADVLNDALPQADVLVAANPVVTQDTLARAPNLRAVIEVSGAFPDTIDYAACAARGVEVLSCSPGFRSAVAEMGLAMTLAASRGLVREHEAFRTGAERWLDDCTRTDFTLFGAALGFVGFGQIGQEMARVLAPFSPRISVFDPWLPDAVVRDFAVRSTDLMALAATSQVLYVTAVPTADNAGLISAEVLAAMPDHAVLVILSRAHLVDFDAVIAEAASGRLTVATDVFASEPLDTAHVLRALPGVVLSPHRAAAVRGGRHLIGDLILRDLTAIAQRDPTRHLAVASPDTIARLAGVGDAAAVADMAATRS